jgi:hypothetical protein
MGRLPAPAVTALAPSRFVHSIDIGHVPQRLERHIPAPGRQHPCRHSRTDRFAADVECEHPIEGSETLGPDESEKLVAGLGGLLHGKQSSHQRAAQLTAGLGVMQASGYAGADDCFARPTVLGADGRISDKPEACVLFAPLCGHGFARA